MKAVIIIMTLIVIVFVFLVLVLIKAASNQEKKIYENGLEADSVVSKVERHLDSDHGTRYNCYVKYTGNDGIEREGR